MILTICPNPSIDCTIELDNLNVGMLNRIRNKVETYSYRDNYGYYAYSVRERGRFNISLSVSYKINNYKKRMEKILDNNDYPEDMGE